MFIQTIRFIGFIAKVLDITDREYEKAYKIFDEQKIRQ